MSDVVLVSMPFGPLFLPSIGASLLKAGLADERVSVRVRYFTIEFAERVGQAFYWNLSEGNRPALEILAGEWLFAHALFGTTQIDDERYVGEVLRDGGRTVSPALIKRILLARGQVHGFLEWCLDQIRQDQPRLVGFTSMFQQHVASLALARRLKDSLPETFIAFGGANCEGVMGAETIRQFPFVDAVVSGEGDLVFPELVRRVLASEPVSGLPGVRTQDGIDAEFRLGSFPNAPMVRNLDDLPYPDYGDFFEQFEASRYGPDWQPSLPFEASRGCWWGQKSHCTFCGLNHDGIAYRSKSARRAVDEIVQLAARYPDCDIEVVDNILDLRYFRSVLPELAARRLSLGLFVETKANLKKAQVRLLRDAGVTRIQPGIESFSDSVLKLIRKGVSGLQNIQLLKWCKELGVDPSWNLLSGFPGEPPEEYARMARLIPLLTHLKPPVDCSGIRLDRFSPNFFDADKLGFAHVKPIAPYRHVYPLSDEAVAHLACYFEFRYQAPQDVDGYARLLRKETRAWKRVHEHSDLFAVDADEHLLIWDFRPVSKTPLTVLRGLDRILYQACDAASGPWQLRRLADRCGFGPVPPGDVEQRLQPLLSRGLLATDGSRYLALAVPLGEYSPSASIVERFYETTRVLGRSTRDEVVVPLDLGCAGAARARRGSKTRGNGGRPKRSRRSLTLSPSQFRIDDYGRLVVRKRSARTHEKGEARG